MPELQDNAYIVTSVNEDICFNVEFRKKYYNVSVIYDKSQGTVKINGEEVTSVTLKEGASAVFTISPENDYKIQQVLLNGNDITTKLEKGTYTVTMMEDVTLKAIFADPTSVLKLDNAGLRIYAISDMVIVENNTDEKVVLIIRVSSLTFPN